jgi:DNA repair protein SbcD/Mre11
MKYVRQIHRGHRRKELTATALSGCRVDQESHMSVKLFHTADIHIGLPFTKHKSVKAELEAARYQTLENMVKTANDSGCQLFVIAGDLFDTTTVPNYAVTRTAEILRKFEGGHLLVMPGNHDYKDFGQDSNWAVFQNQNIKNLLFLENNQVEELQVNGIKVIVYAAPCDKKHSSENKLSWIKKHPKDKNAFNLGIAHGALETLSPDFEQKYFPMQLSELRNTEIDLWLLGHTHISYPVKPDRTDKIFMPGTPEPDGFDCAHEGTAWLFEIQESKKVSATRLSTGSLRFRTIEINLNTEKDLEKMKADCATFMNKQTLVKITVQGRISQQTRAQWQEFRDQLNQKTLLCIINESGLIEMITRELVESEYAEGSFPMTLLKDFLDKDPGTLQKAYDLLQGAKQ